MPIYEFYCAPCHRMFNFFSATVNTEARPLCPQCGKSVLERRMSRFSTPRKSDREETGMPDMDESRLERAMEHLAQEAESVNEDDPRQAARLMRKFSEATGLQLGPRFEEALHRLEKGEDPEALEEELGDLSEEEPFVAESRSRAAMRKEQPSVDDRLYFL